MVGCANELDPQDLSTASVHLRCSTLIGGYAESSPSCSQTCAVLCQHPSSRARMHLQEGRDGEIGCSLARSQGCVSVCETERENLLLRIDDRGSCDLSARSRAPPESTIRKSPGHGQLVSLGRDIDCGSVQTCLGRTMTPKTDGRSSVLVARLEWSAGTGHTSTLSGPGA